MTDTDNRQRPVVLCILDGWGHREAREANAVALADTPNWDRLAGTCPKALLATSGRDVGLPDGQFGNSEVGHMNLGAGRVVRQELVRIGDAIADGTIARNDTLRGLIETLRDGGGRCHLLGLVSPGGVHSHQDHLAALARLVAEGGVEVVVHAFTDGRDTAPDRAAAFVGRFIEDVDDLDGVSIGTVSGRYFAMDRDNRWDRIERAYDAIVAGTSLGADDPLAAIAAAADRGETDEFVQPTVIDGYQGMRDGDGLLCANFRSDRVRQILGALLDPEFDGFERGRRVTVAAAVAMVSYSARLDTLLDVLFPPERLADGLGALVSSAGLTQLRLAETEKYPHVTFFFNGGEEMPAQGEDRSMVPSPKVATYDLQPEMSAAEVTRRLVEAIDSRAYDLIVVNYANADMVGHTGSLEAAIRAVEAVDAGIGDVAAALGRVGGVMVLTADHGNCEMMVDPETGGPHTAHTLNPVPVLLVGGLPGTDLVDGRLADVAPTLLELLGVHRPDAMTGRSLLRTAESRRASG